MHKRSKVYRTCCIPGKQNKTANKISLSTLRIAIINKNVMSDEIKSRLNLEGYCYGTGLKSFSHVHVQNILRCVNCIYVLFMRL
jgi:hypothetical protein